MEFGIHKNFKVLKVVHINHFHRPRCQTKAILNVVITGGFISILFIPTLPLKKICFLSCQQCKKRIQKKDLNDVEKEKVANHFDTTVYKKPLRHFIGILILIVIIGFALFIGFQIKQQERTYIEHPKVNDVYYVKSKLGWTTFKVSAINEDSVYVFQNKIILKTYQGIDEIDEKENYLNVVGFQINELKEMFKSNQIYQVNR